MARVKTIYKLTEFIGCLTTVNYYTAACMLISLPAFPSVFLSACFLASINGMTCLAQHPYCRYGRKEQMAVTQKLVAVRWFKSSLMLHWVHISRRFERILFPSTSRPKRPRRVFLDWSTMNIKAIRYPEKSRNFKRNIHFNNPLFVRNIAVITSNLVITQSLK